ncbi:uncharacterized protein LOC143450505 [Clavelina lepadiformis]|uniref:uncharacterized protein LOC143450505 n=1 Tax=Clavelina lepadiformis TaxID=159417 RepID=UPI00404322ED
MDYKELQQKLKASIAQHQVIMGNLKNNPKDEILQRNLKEVESQIAQLGFRQKKVVKSGKLRLTTPESSQPPPESSGKKEFPTGNSVTGDQNGDKLKTTSGFVRLAPLHNDSGASFTIRILENDKIPPASSQTENGSDIEQNKVVKHNTKSVSVTSQSSQFSADATKGEPVAVKASEEVKEKKDVKSEPLNLSHIVNKKVMISTNQVVTSAKIPTSFQVTNTSAVPTLAPSAGKIIVNSPMKIRVPVSSNGHIVLLPTAKMKPRFTTPILRFAACQPSLLKSSEKAHLWPNLAGANNAQNQHKFIPASLRGGPQNETIGTFQKFRIICGKTPILKPRIPNTITSVVATSSPRPCSTQLQAVLLQSQTPAIKDQESASTSTVTPVPTSPHDVKPTSLLPIKEEDCDVPSTSAEIKKELSSEGVCPSQPKVESEATSLSNDKINFLDRLELVPREKAEKMRNRRYGRRRVSAHPVYSGGMYVSTTAADSTKRVLPTELIGFEEIPIKRPRGRPRNSTKPGVFPAMPLGGEEDEVIKILENTRPNKMTSNEPSTSERPGVKTRKSKKQNAQDEDLCAVCGKAGEVLMCDTCSSVTHLTCLQPQLSEIPTGMWFCDVCKSKFNDRATAPAWPGLMSIVHSYFAYDVKRDESLARARVKNRMEKARKIRLEQQMKSLTSILKEKVSLKNKHKVSLQENMKTCEHLTTLLERIRCAINNNLDAS